MDTTRADESRTYGNTRDRYVAVVVAAPRSYDTRVCGLTLVERAVRVVRRRGAAAVVVTGRKHPMCSADAYVALADIADHPLIRGRDVLVVRAVDQVVHTPLVEAALPVGRRDVPIVVVSAEGVPAGAMWLPASRTKKALHSLDDDLTLGVTLLADNARASLHGEIACHRVVTRADCRKATAMLFRLVRKPQDSALIRLVNRRVSYPFTRILLLTPVTPNVISLMVLAIGMLGCWFTAQPGYTNPVIGTLLVLLAGYLDGCDGEIARLRLESSRVGAWLDTIVDETTTVMILIAVGLHVHATHGLLWIPWTIAVGAVFAVAGVYVIYYYLIIVAHSCNSQDYPTTSTGWLAPFSRVLKRDFINLAAVGLALAGWVEFMYVILLIGAIVSGTVLMKQHIELRLSGVEPIAHH